jgi:hypothetical protein
VVGIKVSFNTRSGEEKWKGRCQFDGGRGEESAALQWLESVVRGRETDGAGQRWRSMALLLGWRKRMTAVMGWVQMPTRPGETGGPTKKKKERKKFNRPAVGLKETLGRFGAGLPELFSNLIKAFEFKIQRFKCF